MLISLMRGGLGDDGFERHLAVERLTMSVNVAVIVTINHASQCGGGRDDWQWRVWNIIV